MAASRGINPDTQRARRFGAPAFPRPYCAAVSVLLRLR